MVYLCNAAVMSAVNSRHDLVEEDDILAAEMNYSQFAYEALLVENGITVKQLDSVLLEFMASDAILPASAVRANLSVAGISADEIDYVVGRLKGVSFLGVEVGPGRFEYVEGDADSRRLDVLARKYSQNTEEEPRYSIHPAYRSYLEVRN
jgi:hypothetical protein